MDHQIKTHDEQDKVWTEIERTGRSNKQCGWLVGWLAAVRRC